MKKLKPVPNKIIRDDRKSRRASVHGQNTKPPVQLCPIENEISSTETWIDDGTMEAATKHDKAMIAEVPSIPNNTSLHHISLDN